MRLLSPQGALFGAMHAADADRLIHFLFPPERLPEHTQVGRKVMHWDKTGWAV